METRFLHPRRVSFDREEVELVELGARTFELLHFHDAIELRHFSIAARWSFRELFPIAERLVARARPPRFIFHGAFCGSTLLARYLDCPGATFSLREPAILTSLACSFGADPSLLEGIGRSVLSAVVALLTETPNAGELAVIKGWDALTPIAAPILSAYPGASAVLVTCAFEPFAIACLKTEARRAWTRDRLSLLEDWGLGTPGDRSAQRTDAEVAAALFLIQKRNLAQLGLFEIDLGELLEQPIACSSRVAAHLAIPIDRVVENVERRLAAPVHAKSGEPYRLEEHRRRTEAERVRLESELAVGRAWLDRTECSV